MAAPTIHDPHATFQLDFRRPVPGARRTPDGWRLSWRGCAVMGVVNVTPDSFSDGGRHDAPERALAHARSLHSAGALVLDIGGESTRPGAEPVPAELELDRVLPVIRALAGSGAVLSIDTMKPEVAAAALAAGAHLVNDVTGLGDPEMLRVCAGAGAAACIMHMRGEPRTMQASPQYGDVVTEVGAFLRERAASALAAGVPGVLLDPGIGFGKRLEHNLSLLRGLGALTAGPEPVLVGASRKGFVGLLGAGWTRVGEGEPLPARERDAGSVAVHLHAASSGAAMVRVHDVAGHVQALRVQRALEGGV